VNGPGVVFIVPLIVSVPLSRCDGLDPTAVGNLRVTTPHGQSPAVQPDRLGRLAVSGMPLPPATGGRPLLFILPDHAGYIDGVLIPAKLLVNRGDIWQIIM
jgi:hypothetical protein